MSALENTVSIFCASKLICGSKDQSRRSIDLEVACFDHRPPLVRFCLNEFQKLL